MFLIISISIKTNKIHGLCYWSLCIETTLDFDKIAKANKTYELCHCSSYIEAVQISVKLLKKIKHMDCIVAPRVQKQQEISVIQFIKNRRRFP